MHVPPSLQLFFHVSLLKVMRRRRRAKLTFLQVLTEACDENKSKKKRGASEVSCLVLYSALLFDPQVLMHEPQSTDFHKESF